VAGITYQTVYPAYYFLLFFGLIAFHNWRRARVWSAVRNAVSQTLREGAGGDRRGDTPRGKWRVIVLSARAGCERDEYVRRLFAELASRAVAVPTESLPHELPAILVAGVSEETAREIAAALENVSIKAIATPRNLGLAFMQPRDFLRQLLLVAPAPFVAALAGFPGRRGGLVVIGWTTLLGLIEITVSSRRMQRLAPVLQLLPSV
jgi:hypothetical protein